MKNNWPSTFFLQNKYLVYLYLLVILLGSFLMGDIRKMTVDEVLPIVLFSCFPFVFIPYVNKFEDFFVFLKRRGKKQGPTVPIFGEDILIKDEGDDEEERNLRVHGDLYRKGRVMAMVVLFAVVAVFFAMKASFFTHPGILFSASIGLSLIMANAHYQILLLPILQTVYLLWRVTHFKELEIVLFIAYLLGLFTLFSSSLLYELKTRFNFQFNIFKKSISNTLKGFSFLFLAFLFFEQVIPNDLKLWQKCLSYLQEKSVSKGNEKKPGPKMKPIDLSKVPISSLPQGGKLNSLELKNLNLMLDTMSKNLDNFLEFLNNMPELELSELKMDIKASQEQIKNMRLKAKREDVDFKDLQDFLDKIGNLDKKIKKKINSSFEGKRGKFKERFSEDDNIPSGLMDSANNMTETLEDGLLDLEILKEDVKERIVQEASPPLMNDQAVQKPKAKAKEEFNFDKVFNFFKVIFFLIVLWFLFKFLRQFTQKDLVDEDDQKELKQFLKKYKRIRKKKISLREEVIQTYHLLHEMIQKRHFELLDMECPPPKILEQLWKSKNDDDFKKIVHLFQKVKYGDFDVKKTEIQAFRNSFQSVFLLIKKGREELDEHDLHKYLTVIGKTSISQN